MVSVRETTSSSSTSYWMELEKKKFFYWVWVRCISNGTKSLDIPPKFTKKARIGILFFNWQGVNKRYLSTYLWPVSWAMCRAVWKPTSWFTLPAAFLQIEFKLARAEKNNTLLSLLLFFEFYKALSLSSPNSTPVSLRVLFINTKKKKKLG